MDFAVAIGVGFVVLIFAFTIWMARNRERTRAAARESVREAEQLNVMSNDTRRASWYSGADHSDHGSESSGGGGDGGSD